VEPVREGLMGAEEHVLFSSEELTRIYRETAAAAEPAGDRLTVLLAPYGSSAVPQPRQRED
jgi:hypothetical protein